MSSPQSPHYTLPNDWTLARERLAALEEALDPASIALAGRHGAGPGWRCLEAGAGGGSFARWLCGTALPGGRVVTVDLDPRHLDDLPGLGGEVVAADLVDGELPEGPFDLVHTRLVLLHIAAREHVLDRLVAALAPGGVLLIEEQDVFGVLDAMTGAYGETWRVFEAMSRAAGLHPTWARTLPERLAARGLQVVESAAEIAMFCGGSAYARLWSLTWRQAREPLIATGAAPETIDAAHAELADPARWFTCPAMVRVAARRPG